MRAHGRYTETDPEFAYHVEYYPDWSQDAGAIFSEGRTHRYLLWRVIGIGEGICLFIMANPSKADERRSDNSVTRCIAFAKRWGFGRVVICNLKAIVGTDPKSLEGIAFADQVSHPFEPARNNVTIDVAIQTASRVVAGWGILGSEQHEYIISLIEARDKFVYCLGKTQEGYPRHISRLGYDSKLEPLVA